MNLFEHVVNWFFAGILTWFMWWNVGYALIRLLKETLTSNSFFEKLGLPIILGAIYATLLQTVFAFFQFSIFYSLILLHLFAIAQTFVLLRKNWTRYVSRIYNFRFSFVLLLLIPFFVTLFLFGSRSYSRSIYAWDAIAFWLPKTYVLAYDQVIQPNSFERFNHPEYPLFLPMLGADAFLITGTHNEMALKVSTFGFSVAFICAVVGFFFRTTPKKYALFFSALLCSLFIFREHISGEYVGTSDVFVGISIATGTMLWLEGKRTLAHWFWVGAPWAKSEGLVWYLSTAGMSFLLAPKKFARLIIPTFFATVWILFTKVVGMSSQYFKFSELYSRPWIEYAVYSVHAFREEFRNIQKWNLTFYIFFLQCIFHVKQMMSSRFFPLITAFVVQLVVYMIIFTIAPEEQATFIAAAISRLSLHLAPMLIVVSGYMIRKES